MEVDLERARQAGYLKRNRAAELVVVQTQIDKVIVE